MARVSFGVVLAAIFLSTVAVGRNAAGADQADAKAIDGTQQNEGERPEAKPLSFAVFAPSRTEETMRALSHLLSRGRGEVSIKKVDTLADGIASKAEVLVLMLNAADFGAIGKYSAQDLIKRKTIGIGFGAAMLFGDAGLKISAGNCAHGFSPRIRIEDNATTDKATFGSSFGLFRPGSPKTGRPDDVDAMPFGIYLGDKHPEIRSGLDIIARYSGEQYGAICRQANTVFVGITPDVENWSEPLVNLVGELPPALDRQPLTDPPQPARAPLASQPSALPSALPKWEYKTLSGFGGKADELSPYGAQGWEACGVMTDRNGTSIVIFKRPKQ